MTEMRKIIIRVIMIRLIMRRRWIAIMIMLLYEKAEESNCISIAQL